MLLRRVIKHFREQEWIAIAIDFIIVVVGVFVGMQVSNWNDALNTLKQEKSYLFELRDEVDGNLQIYRNNIKLMEIVVTSGEQALLFLEGDKPCEEDCWQLLVEFFLASQAMALPSTNTVIDEMRRLGLPHSKTIRSKMTIYSNNAAATASVSNELPKYRSHIRGLMPVNVQRALWRDCYRANNGKEVFFINCEATISETDVRIVLDKFRARKELHEELSFWIGQNILILPALADQVRNGEEAIVAIDNELNRQ